MIELPEATNLAKQINDTIYGKRINGVTAAHTAHKFAWYYGEPAKYPDLLIGSAIGKAAGYGSMVEIDAGNSVILMSEGAAIRFHIKNGPRPDRHQLLVEFEDGTAMCATIQMYGGIGSFPQGELDNPYYKVAREKPSPLSTSFDITYFSGIIDSQGVQKLTLKALLATEQRIPGLGNGVLHDILFNAGMHPKKKVGTLTKKDRDMLFISVKDTLAAMASQGGRDTELDLFGKPGGYKTILSKNTVNKPCPVCGTIIKKEAYMGGSIYFCQDCQVI